MAPASAATTGLALPYFKASSRRRPEPVKASTAGTAADPGAGAAVVAHRAHGTRPGRRQDGH